MLQLMFLIFLFSYKYSHYKSECSSQYAENTFLCMRLHPRGLTPSETGMNDRYGDEKGQKNNFIPDSVTIDENATFLVEKGSSYPFYTM